MDLQYLSSHVSNNNSKNKSKQWGKYLCVRERGIQWWLTNARFSDIPSRKAFPKVNVFWSIIDPCKDMSQIMKEQKGTDTLWCFRLHIPEDRIICGFPWFSTNTEHQADDLVALRCAPNHLKPTTSPAAHPIRPGRKGLVVGLLHLIASEAHVAQQIVLAPLFKGGALCWMTWMCFKCVWNVDQTQRRYTRKIRAANHCCPCRCDPAIPQLCAKTMPAWHTFSACVAARGADRPRSLVGHQIYSVPNHQTKH